MKAIIIPSKNKNSAEIKIPASKSLLHRDLICASLSKGTSYIYNVTMNDDVIATIGCLRNLGVAIEIEGNTLKVNSSGKLKLEDNHFYPKESGSTLRFLIPIVGSLNEGGYFHLEGKLGKRPLDDYQKIFTENNAEFTYINNDLLYVKGPIRNREYHLKGNITSQYISGLLMASPLYDEEIRIIIDKPIESKPYVDLTIGELAKFGVEIETIENSKEVIYLKNKNQVYTKQNVTVEGDYSQAAFFLALGMINDTIALNNMPENSLQGDAKIIQFLNELGGKIEFSDNKLISWQANGDNDKNVLLDIKDTPDLGPILMAIAAIKPIETKLINTHRLIYKESNRSFAMQAELTKIGSTVKVFDNEIIIDGISLENRSYQKEIVFDSHNDHRIVMSLAIIATRLMFCEKIIINNVEAINKSYPNFFNDLQKVGIKVTLEE